MGKKVLITGGSRGIGLTLCQEFLKNEYEVYSIYHTDAVDNSVNSDVEYFKCDCRDFEQLKDLKADLNSRDISIDVLINNAGILKDKTIKNLTEEDWYDVMQTNLAGTFYCSKLFLDDMIKHNFGRIITISSVVAHTGNFGQTNYAASKSGILGFTKSLALETSKYNITVNAIAPGFIKTEMTKTIPDNILINIIEKIPKMRLGTPEEIAHVALFLVSEKSGYITGETININGGYYM